MTEQEREILRRLLITLFLESPRKTGLNQQHKTQPANATRETEKHQPGGKKHGR